MQLYLLAPDCPVIYWPNFLRDIQPGLSESLLSENTIGRVPWSDNLWGRRQRRLFTKQYIETHVKLDPKLDYYQRGEKKGLIKPASLDKLKRPRQPMTPSVRRTADVLTSIMGLPVDAVLLNLYRGRQQITKSKKQWTAGAGKDCITPHRDHTKLPIVSLSNGHGRLFHIIHEATGNLLTLNLGGHGDLLVMASHTNDECLHWIPPQPVTQGTPDRLNLTARPTASVVAAAAASAARTAARRHDDDAADDDDDDDDKVKGGRPSLKKTAKQRESDNSTWLRPSLCRARAAPTPAIFVLTLVRIHASKDVDMNPSVDPCRIVGLAAFSTRLQSWPAGGETEQGLSPPVCAVRLLDGSVACRKLLQGDTSHYRGSP